MSVTNEVENLITTLNDALTDATKHDTGNNAAGGRLRKALQEVVTARRYRMSVIHANSTSQWIRGGLHAPPYI